MPPELPFQSALLLSSPRFPICIPTLSISPLKMFPFQKKTLISSPSSVCLILFFLTSSFSPLLSLLFPCLFSFSSVYSILSTPVLVLLLSFLSSPISFAPLAFPEPEKGELRRARSPGIHQYRIRVFFVMGAEGQGALALQHVGGSDLILVSPSAAQVLAGAAKVLHDRLRSADLLRFPSAQVLPGSGAHDHQDSASMNP